MRNRISWLLVVSFFVLTFSSGCANFQERMKNINLTKVVPTLLGAGIGAAADEKKRWRGGAIGAAAGFLAGMTLEDMMKRATEEAAKTGEKVSYEDDKGNKVEAVPKAVKGVENCSEVTRTVTIDGKKEVSSEKICEVKTTKYIY